MSQSQRWSFLGVAILAATTTLLAQTPITPPAQRRAADVVVQARALALTAPATSQTTTEFTINWTIAPANTAIIPQPQANAPALANQFAVAGRRSMNERMVVERDPQLAEGLLLVVAVAADGSELGWQIVKDPRVIRAELPGTDGTLTGQTLYRTVTQLIVSVPGDVAATGFRVYEPRWNGTEFMLVLLGTVAAGAP